MKKILVFLFGLLCLSLTACSKSESRPVSSTAEAVSAGTVKSSNNGSASQSDEVFIDEYIEDENADPEHKYLAVDPSSCIITHCDQYAGFEDNGLACETQDILASGYTLGSTTFRTGEIMRGGSDCVYQGEDNIKCFLDEQEYKDYILYNGLDCGVIPECLKDPDCEIGPECLYETDECVPYDDDEERCFSPDPDGCD